MVDVKVVEKIVDICSKQNLYSVFEPIAGLPPSCTKAEMVSHCLNQELGAYGLKTYVSPDKTSVLLDDKNMSQIIDFFSNKAYQPVITQEHAERVGNVIDFANKNEVDLLWAQSGMKKSYYYFKQYGFNGVNLYNLLNINTLNAAAATISPTGAAAVTMAGVVAVSWSGSLFFSTIENYIPNNMVKTKTTVGIIKVGFSLPIRCVEWTSNQMFGFVEKIVIGRQLPTNVTEVYKLNIGPKIKNITEVKKPILTWIINQLKKWNN